MWYKTSLQYQNFKVFFLFSKLFGQSWFWWIWPLNLITFTLLNLDGLVDSFAFFPVDFNKTDRIKFDDGWCLKCKYDIEQLFLPLSLECPETSYCLDTFSVVFSKAASDAWIWKINYILSTLNLIWKKYLV